MQTEHNKRDIDCETCPEGLGIDRGIPLTQKEWRADTQWSIDLVDRHQAASEAAYMAYWKIMGTEQK